MEITRQFEATTVVYHALNPRELTRVLASGIDHATNLIQPFIDREGGWPLRCCLTDSRPADELAIIAGTIAFSPFAWSSQRICVRLVIAGGDW